MALCAGRTSRLHFIQDKISGRRFLCDSGAQSSILPASAADIQANTDTVKLLLSFPCLEGVAHPIGILTGFHLYNDPTVFLLLYNSSLYGPFVVFNCSGGFNEIGDKQLVAR